MTDSSPVRPARRAARRNVIKDEESDDEMSLIAQEVEEEEFTPAPKRSPRKSARRQTTANVEISPKKPARARRARTGDTIEPSEIFDADQSMALSEAPSPKKATRGRRTKTGDSIEPSQIFDAEHSMLPSEPTSPTKRASPRKRKSAPASRTSRRSSIVPPVPALPTPESETPEPTQAKASPLGDITKQALNRPHVLLPPKDQKPKSIAQVLETPMEIVIKNRTIPATVVEEPSGPKPRMVIKQLVMTNFKSYAGRQVVGPFHVSFSSVVGPNGSGKSNVIDSLLFVFGFRASKMRQGKISALIHNSAQHQDLDFCEVEVHFQKIMDLPGGKYEVMPDTQMVVSRRAFKNNSSNYYLNGRTTNFTAVTTLLKDEGIDLDHKRFLILQGEVESIAQMKPKAANEHDDGLLEYLEDIIGTAKYKTPIEEAVIEAESLNEVCVEKQTRVQHVEKEKNGLEDKKNKALAYIRDENELAEKQSALYQIYIAECEDNTKVTDEAIEQMQANLTAELEKHAGNEDSIKELEKAYKKAAKQYEAMEKSTQEMIKEMAKYEKESVKFEERRKFISGKQKKAEKTGTTSRLAASEATSEVQRHVDDIERKSAQVIELEAQKTSAEHELASIRDNLKGKTQGISDQIAAKQKSLEPWNEKINQTQSAMAVAQSELDLLQEKANSGQKAIDEAREKIKGIKAAGQSKMDEKVERQAEGRRIEKDIRKLQDAIQKLSASEPEMRSRVSSARQKADEARASLASSQNQGNVLKGLMRLKDSGRIDGFHGRLGNLGTIDEKYDVAISTACSALENMVVDSVEAGQQCIEYLRKNNLGRANFICLDKLAQRDLSAMPTPENVPRLFDLVKPKDKKFASAFYSIMQNTLVANDLEQANRIAYGAKRWRVVTLDGQLIDVSGTMSGGGTRVARGAMSSKLVAETTKEQVQMLEVDRDTLENQFETFQAKQRELEGSLRENQDQIPKLETIIQKLDLEIENQTCNLNDAKKRLEELVAEHSNVAADDSQIKPLEKQITAFEKTIEKLHSETSNVEAEIQALQDKIMEVGGIKLRTQKAKVDGLKEQIDLLTDEISSAEVAKTKNDKLKAKHEKAKLDTEKELATLEKDMEKLEADVAKQASGASESKAKGEAAKDELDLKKEELGSLKKDLDTQTSELNETRAVEIEMRNKLEENQKILADNHKKSRYWSEKLSKLSLHDIADLEGTTDQAPVKQEEKDPYAAGPGDEDVEMTDLPEEEEVQPRPSQGVSASRKQLPTYTRDELEDKSKDHLVAAIAALEEKTSNASSIDLTVIGEYRRRCNDLATRTGDLNAALATRDAAKTRLADLRSLRLNQFMTGFTTISGHLKSMYQLITLGGNAELELVDSLDPFSEGILFSVMPPKKSWKNIGNLSGGEKTLSSLALVFALHVYRPTPLYVMDEIDAALDFRNVSCPFPSLRSAIALDFDAN
jgi:structural maintenance of chromosome 4